MASDPGRAWVRMLDDDEATADLLEALDDARSPSGTVDNVMRVHSLRPDLMRAHTELYRTVLHGDARRLPPWLAEVLATYVAMLDGCDYAVAHHGANARHLIGDDARADAVERALRDRDPAAAFDGAELAMLRYAEVLTLAPGEVTVDAVEAMREHGVDDEVVLEVNAVVGYFAYVVRLLTGLGVSLDGDVVGNFPEGT